ncbi:Glyoxalase 2-4 [Dorcoceras hygrometricum]|uniref:Glyoxalase 2-4 n=1 Tax=Dorcoceras hygrometricum TaxID=472368 RepID=A0A2Z7DBK6_9LAMI|nr:Glyoxalase 2-4 [Dorcoceras hygrometricum]
MKTKILAVPDGEFLSLEDLTRTCRTKRAFPPSVMSIEPLTEVRWSQAIHIKEVHWRNKSIPQIAPTDKGKKVRDSLFSKVSRLIRDAWINDKALKKSIEDNIATVLMDRDRVSSRSLQTEIDGSCEIQRTILLKTVECKAEKFCTWRRLRTSRHVNYGAARLRDFMSSIHSVKLQSQELISSSKSDCNKRMTSLEVSVEDLRQSHMSLVNKQWRKHLYFLRRGDKLKADLSLEITATRMLLQNQSAEVNSSLASLSSQLAEVVAHLKRAGDVKKGEGGNSSSKKKVKVAVEESADGSESSF